jgi:cell division protein FtsA
MRDSMVIMDIGSSSIVTLVGGNGVNGTFNIYGKGEVSYAGFQNAEFLEPESLKFAIANSISYAESESDLKITDLYLGVPGEFCTCVTKTVDLNFPKHKKINRFDVENIYKIGANFETNEYTLINKSVIYFDIDGVKRVIDPVGLKAKKITGQISYILAQNTFLKQMRSIFSELKINVSGLVSSVLAECLYLFEPSVRDKYVLLADCGYITTNVALSRGNALLFLNSFSMGGGYITSDLSQCLKINFNEAERLKRKVVLGWNATQSDTYEIEGDEYLLTYSAKATNEIVSDRVEMIAEYIQMCLDRCDYDLPDFLPLYVTGGGLSSIKGIGQVLSKKLNRQVIILSQQNLNFIKPYDSSEEGLLNLVLNHEDILDEIIVRIK